MGRSIVPAFPVCVSKMFLGKRLNPNLLRVCECVALTTLGHTGGYVYPPMLRNNIKDNEKINGSFGYIITIVINQVKVIVG